MNPVICNALEAIYAEELPENIQQKTINVVLRTFDVSPVQMLVYMSEKHGDDREKLARFLKTTFERDCDQRDRDAPAPAPVTPIKKRGRSPLSPSPPPTSPWRVPNADAHAQPRAPVNLVSCVAFEAADENIKNTLKRQENEAKIKIAKINNEVVNLLPTGMRRQGVGVSWSKEEEDTIKKLICSGRRINCYALSKYGKTPLFDRTDKAINNKVLEIKKRITEEGNSQTDSDLSDNH